MEIFLLILLICDVLLILIAWMGVRITNKEKIITKHLWVYLYISFVIGVAFGFFVTAMMIY